MSNIVGKPLMAGGGTGKGLEFTYTGDYTEREDGVVELRSSGTITFSKTQRIDIFCVGGGGAGGTNYYNVSVGCGGGGGGFTKTAKRQTVSGTYTVTIGAGGAVTGGATDQEPEAHLRLAKLSRQMAVTAEETLKAQIMVPEEVTAVPVAAREEKQLPVSAAAMAKRVETRRASMQQAALDRERPQGSSGKVLVNCTPEAAVAAFGLRSGLLAARAAVVPVLALA